MKNITILKIIIAILIAIILFISIAPYTFAAIHIPIDNITSQKDKGDATQKTSEIIGKVINWIQVISAGIAIIMLIVIGITWVGSAPSGKAQIAKSSKYYIMGAVFIFAAIGLLQIVKNFTDNSFGKI